MAFKRVRFAVDAPRDDDSAASGVTKKAKRRKTLLPGPEDGTLLLLIQPKPTGFIEGRTGIAWLVIQHSQIWHSATDRKDTATCFHLQG